MIWSATKGDSLVQAPHALSLLRLGVPMLNIMSAKWDRKQKGKHLQVDDTKQMQFYVSRSGGTHLHLPRSAVQLRQAGLRFRAVSVMSVSALHSRDRTYSLTLWLWWRCVSR